MSPIYKHKAEWSRPVCRNASDSASEFVERRASVRSKNCSGGAVLRSLALILMAAIYGLASGVQALPAIPNGATALAVQADSAGNLYVAGATSSGHAFVAELAPGNTQTLWFTSFAGSKSEAATVVALGPDGSVFAAGVTQSTDFPTTQGAMQPTGNAGSVFAVKLDANGNVLYATYVPTTYCAAIATDSVGHLMLTGTLIPGESFTATPGAVMGAPLPPALPFPYYTTSYLLELDPSGRKSDLAIVGFGGSEVAFDSQGYIYAAGAFGQAVPTTKGAFQSDVTGKVCATSQISSALCQYQHIAKIDPTGTQLIYATYLAGSWGASPSGMAVDTAGNVILAGTTSSPDYPTTADAYQPESFGNPQPQYLAPASMQAPTSAGYVTKLNATGTGLIWSTYFAGSGANIPDSLPVGDLITGMAVDASGNVLIEGFAMSPDLPGLWNTPVAARPAIPPAGTLYNPVGFLGRIGANGSTIAPTQLVSAMQFSQPAASSVSATPDGDAVLVASLLQAAPLFDVSLGALGRVEAICDPADEAKIVNVAAGQLLTLYGSNLAPANSSSGVAISFNGIAAPILYASGDQINLQVPYEIAGQTEVTMQVSSSSVTPVVSESYILGVAPRQPSAFVSAASFTDTFFDVATCNGQTIAGTEALALNADGTLNSCANPAAAGSTVMLFLDGMGVTSPAQATGAISTSAVAIAPPAALVPPPNGSLPVALPTQTISGLLADVVAVEVSAPTSSSAIQLELVDAQNLTYLVRGPGVIIWVVQ